MAVFYGKELVAGGLDMLAITNQIAELSTFIDSKLNELSGGLTLSMKALELSVLNAVKTSSSDAVAD